MALVIMSNLPALELVLDSIQKDHRGWSYAHYHDYLFSSVFQPIFNRDMTTYAYEGLARIKDLNGKSINPDIFFSQMNKRKDRQCEDLVAHLCIHLHLQNFASLGVRTRDKILFFNFPPESFVRREFGELKVSLRAKEDIANLGLHADKLVCELQEFSTDNIDRTKPGIYKVRQAGIRIALDDYGSEASDLNRVKLISPDIVKLDMKYVQRRHEFCHEIMEIIHYCKEHQIQIIAEGIETEDQLNHFKKLGVYGFQGYLLSHPKTPPELSGSLLPPSN